MTSKLRLPLAVAAGFATVASAWATYSSSYVPDVTNEPANAAAQPASATSAVRNEDALLANDTLVPAPAAPSAQPVRAVVDEAPVATPAPQARAEPAITVTKPRLTVDQRIQADVMEALARNPNLSGRIGVVTQDRVVTLTGYTTTSGQAYRAGREALGVHGVRQVVNEIRPRVGAITS